MRKSIVFSGLLLGLSLISASALASWGHPYLRVTHRRDLSPRAVQTLSTLPHGQVYCKFPHGLQVPTSFAVFNLDTQTITLRTTNPPQMKTFTGISVVNGIPPYNDAGYAIVAFGDVPIIYVQSLNSWTQFTGALFNHQEVEATWGTIPGGPSGVVDAGECSVGHPDFTGGLFNDFQGM